MNYTTATETTTQYAIRWPDGEVQGPVDAEFAEGVKRDRDLGPTVTILRREAVTTFGEWAETP